METAGGIDEQAVDALREERLDWRFKAVPPRAHGLTAGDFAATRPQLSGFGTPLLTLDAAALEHNTAVVADWAAAAGVLLAPHGKTTMAPQLWRRQLAAGAWGITLANLPQLLVARAFGVSRLLLANTLVDPGGLAWLSAELDRDPGFGFLSWVDSTDTVALMDEALRAAGAGRPVDVCIELGGPRGRAGVREEPEALRIAEAVRASPVLRLVGIGGYEGALAHDESARSFAAVRDWLGRLAALHARLPYETSRPVVTAGGSAFPDLVTEQLAGLPETDVVLRSGAYLVHDDGFYRGISPFGRADRLPGTAPLRSAMHGWARVVSRPEPELALLDAGKRDLSFDEGFPEPQRVRGRGPLTAPAEITKLNDQHAFLRGPGAAGTRIGDVLRLGPSHPCTALDRWTLLPVVEDADAPDPVVTGLVRTFF
jgi:D-serine deaminase-like pyridoxal phosphate-dependent protein